MDLYHRNYQAVDCKRCSTQNCFISLYCTEDQQTQINKDKHLFSFKPGQYIVNEGGAFSGIYFIRSGKVKVYKQTGAGKIQIVRLASDGDIVGHRGFGGNWTYSISASALEDTSLCFIPDDLFIGLLKTSVVLSYQLMLFYADELRKTEWRWKMMTVMNAKERVSFALLMISDAFLKKRKDGAILNLLLTRKEIGEIATTTGEQVSREITALTKDGVICRVENKRRDIVIKDYLGLQSMLENYSDYPPGN